MRYHYIVVRNDLPPGEAAAMVGHAAGESFADSGQSAPYPSVKNPGHPLSPVTIIVLEASPRRLKSLKRQLQKTKFGYRRRDFYEPDRGHRGALMSIGFWPVTQMDRQLDHIQLLRKLPLYGQRYVLPTVSPKRRP